MADYKAAFEAASLDLSTIMSALGFTSYPGIDPMLRAISDLILAKAEAQALREEVARGNRITVSMALDIAAVGEALGIPGEQQEGGTGEFIDLILELKRDAERYRWVKQRAWYVDRAAEVYEIDHIKVAGFKEAVPVDDDDVEAAIDRAMAEGALLGEEKEPSA